MGKKPKKSKGMDVVDIAVILLILGILYLVNYYYNLFHLSKLLIIW